MKSLLAKLEAATEGSRDLDAEIHCAITGRVTHRCLSVGFTMVGTGDTVKDFHLASSNYITSKRGPAPNYTTSLDAAMTLVPEGWEWSVGSGNKTEPVQPAYASVWPEEQPFPAELDICTEAATPALALVTAALRTRGETE